MDMRRNFHLVSAAKTPITKKNSRASHREAMKFWTKPLEQHAFVRVNRDTSVTCLIITHKKLNLARSTCYEFVKAELILINTHALEM